MTTQNVFDVILASSWFGGYLIGVQVLKIITARLRSIIFIKSVHTVVFVPLSALLFALVYEVAVDRTTFLAWIAIAVFLAEMVVLMTHNWKCPLTLYAEQLGSTHGQITDFFFPKWFADHVFLVYGGLFVISILVLIIRLFI